MYNGVSGFTASLYRCVVIKIMPLVLVNGCFLKLFQFSPAYRASDWKASNGVGGRGNLFIIEHLLALIENRYEQVAIKWLSCWME